MNLLELLDQPLQEIGYCLTEFNTSVYNDSNVQEELVMILSINFTESQRPIQQQYEQIDGDSSSYDTFVNDTVAQVIVSLIAVNLWKTRERKRTLENPLLELVYHPDELTTFESVLIKKIIENLRTQYMCHLRIQSFPEGAHVRSINGLEGTTPLEWITPVGKLPIIAELEGYETMRRRIYLTSPGTHTYELQLPRYKFYHSKWFKPSIALATVSVASFISCLYYDNKYHHLKETDRTNEPEKFEKYNHIAIGFQIAGFSTLACSGASFALCFKY